MKQILIIICISMTCIFSTVYSQSLDNELLNDYYYSEDIQESDFYLQKLYFPESLNFDIQSEYQIDSTFNAIGISSAEIDSINGYNQAFTRALCVASLNKSVIKGVADYFENSNDLKSTSNLGYYYKIISKDTFNLSNIKILNNEVLSNGETILKIGISNKRTKLDSNKIKVNVESSIYKSSYNVGRYTYTDVMLNINISTKNLHTNENHQDSLQVTLIDNNIPTLSQIFDTTKLNIRKYYKYLNSQSDIDNVNFTKFSAYNGIWQAVVCSIYSNIVNELNYNNAYIYNINDLYNKEKEENLNREVLKSFKASVFLNKIYCFRNEICTLINIK